MSEPPILYQSLLGDKGSTVQVPVYIHSLKNKPIGNIELTFYKNGYAMTPLKVNRFTASMIKGASAIELYADMKNEIAKAVVVFISRRMSTEEFNELRKYKIYPLWDKDRFVEVV